MNIIYGMATVLLSTFQFSIFNGAHTRWLIYDFGQIAFGPAELKFHECASKTYVPFISTRLMINGDASFQIPRHSHTNEHQKKNSKGQNCIQPKQMNAMLVARALLVVVAVVSCLFWHHTATHSFRIFCGARAHFHLSLSRIVWLVRVPFNHVYKYLCLPLIAKWYFHFGFYFLPPPPSLSWRRRALPDTNTLRSLWQAE